MISNTEPHMSLSPASGGILLPRRRHSRRRLGRVSRFVAKTAGALRGSRRLHVECLVDPPPQPSIGDDAHASAGVYGYDLVAGDERVLEAGDVGLELLHDGPHRGQIRGLAVIDVVDERGGVAGPLEGT